MSVNENVTRAADVTTGGDRGDCQSDDAMGEASTDPATAEVSKGVACLPSPNKTAAGSQQAMYSILEETPPWTRESFLFNISSFQEDVGASPVTTGRLTPGLRRLCLDASPSLAWAKAERYSHLHPATSPTLENETPPWMKASFMDYSVTTPTEPANSVELPGGAGTVITVPLPDIVTMNVQNDTMDVGCEGKSPACTPPKVDSTSAQNAVDSPCRDSPALAIASTDRQAMLINSTIHLAGGSNTPGSASDITVPTEEMNSTTNLTSGCSSPSVAGRNMSASADEINKTTDVANNSAPSIALTPDINTSTGEGNNTMELVYSGRPNMTVPAGASAALSDVVLSNRQMNGTMELAGCVGSATDSKHAEHKDLTVEMGSDCSLISPAVSPSISRPTQELNATVDKENNGKSTSVEVNTTMPVHHNTTMPVHHSTTMPVHHSTTMPVHHSTTMPVHHNTTMPVHHNTTVDFPLGGGTNSAPMAACHNGTLHLAAVAKTPVATKLAREMNNTVDLVQRRSIPSAEPMNSTVELQGTTTTNASPSVTTEVQELTSSVVRGVGSPAAVVNGTVNLTSINSPCVAEAAVVNSTVNLTSVNSPCVAEAAVGNGTVNLTPIGSPCVTGAAVVNSTVNLTCSGSPSVSGIQKLDNTVEMEVSNPSSSPEVVRGHAAVSEKANGVNEECTRPASDTTASAVEQGSVGNAQACAGNGNVSDSATLTMNLNLSEAEVTVERSAPESRLSVQFTLDDSLDLQAYGLVTSTPMPEHREFSFSRPADVVLGRACEARKQLVLPANAIISTTTTNTTTSSSPTAKATGGSDPPGEDGAGTSPAESSPPSEGKTDVHASLAQRQGMVLKATGITLPRAGGAAAAAMAGPMVAGAKSSGLPVTRRTIPKPMRRTGVLGMATVANNTVEDIPAPSGIPSTNRLSLGMKAALRSAASIGPVPQPAPALQRRLSLAPVLSTRLKKKPNEGAIPTVSKEAAASSVRPSRASTGIKRPVPEPKGGPAKRSKEDSAHASVSKDSASIAGRLPRTSTGLRKALPEPKAELRRPSVGPAAKLRSGLLMQKGPVLPTVPEDAISISSNHTISASLVTAPSLDSEGTYLCQGQEHPDRKTDCKNCESLQRQIQQQRQEIEALKAQLSKVQSP
ncbi:flocculation protein FLO11-like isoform X2 [Alosa sapidissima]|uniref:flocculation protein FLO11-like isoform X2 n=1 Tax=Alosa sapidissima TaxID=34773 RepID=UPI001C08C2BA|nr:flocculation protein FLO11-like isoform X2 [Alosa sapidissima]